MHGLPKPPKAQRLELSLSTPAAGTLIAAPANRLNVHAVGMNLHSATTADGRDRQQLLRLAKYLLRPPFAHHAVTWLADGRVRLKLARRNRSVSMTPEQFIANLIALVPPPGVPMIRYAGVFANRHHLRRRIAPSVVDAPAIPTQLPLFDLHGRAAVVGVEHGGVSRPRRIAWARLLARVFSVDILACPRCDGRLVPTAAVLDRDEIAALLHGARGPPRPSPPGPTSVACLTRPSTTASFAASLVSPCASMFRCPHDCPWGPRAACPHRRTPP